jgi:putative ABC transport system permease protein
LPLFEAIRLALGQIRAQKLKSFFTLVGVTIGVTFLIAIVSIVEGMGNYLEEDLVGKLIARNSFEVRRRPNIQLGDVDEAEWRSWRGRPAISEDDYDALLAELPGDTRLSIIREGGVTVNSPFARPRSVRISAVSADWFAIKSMNVTAGRVFTAQEDAAGSPVVVIGEDVKNFFFPALDPIGRELRIASIPYTIIGVAEKQGDIFGQSLDQFVVVPAHAAAHRLLARGKDVSGIIVQSPDELGMQFAMEAARQLMRARHQLRPAQRDNFALQTSDSALEFWNRIKGYLVWAGIALPTVGLIVGAIVIMNIMLVAVAERTHEIGIRKAIGARRMDIMRQFLVESATLSTIGSVFGICLGAGLAALIAKLSPLPTSVALWSVIVAVVVGASVGIISGVYPASRASRLDPILSLRQE